ncbi:Uncharacterised protein [Porphyromonas macacae]|uniref:Lipoprotein n=1 Tax=Porphyromonas macacae TaxID=28115 RepID=A0A379EB51_9PORP|nr:hypothetical protein [Porphyromonas macacae]SUB89601.1 Uncharacterised protein [Porphyromonas macacae]
MLKKIKHIYPLVLLWITAVLLLSGCASDTETEPEIGRNGIVNPFLKNWDYNMDFILNWEGLRGTKPAVNYQNTGISFKTNNLDFPLITYNFFEDTGKINLAYIETLYEENIYRDHLEPQMIRNKFKLITGRELPVEIKQIYSDQIYYRKDMDIYAWVVKNNAVVDTRDGAFIYKHAIYFSSGKQLKEEGERKYKTISVGESIKINAKLSTVKIWGTFLQLNGQTNKAVNIIAEQNGNNAVVTGMKPGLAIVYAENDNANDYFYLQVKAR